MTDRLAALLDHFSVNAHTFNAGPLCGITPLDGREPYGQLHLVREGEVEVRHGALLAARIAEPSLLLYPRPMAHRFITDKHRGAEFVCAQVRFEGGDSNPIAAALPPFVCLPLAQLPDSEPLLRLLFSEAEARNCGRQVGVSRVF